LFVFVRADNSTLSRASTWGYPAVLRSKEVLQNMANEPALPTEALPQDESDNVWGMAEIGRELNIKTAKEVGYLLNHTKLLDGVVRRISHKKTLASRRKLRNLAATILARD
jgi:hypothetical protein